MTITDESVDVTPETEEGDTDESGSGRKRDRDFTKFNDKHQELADYINTHSGLDPVTPNQVKAVTTLQTDFRNSPEQAAAREARKAEREAEKSKYAGMNDEQIKQAKAAEKVERQAAKLQARLNDALARAAAIREGKEATGEDLAAEVESAQNGSNEDSAETPKRRFGRNK